MKTIIIGGVAAGGSAAARLRRLNETAHIIIYECGEHISFANCGLPYYIGGEIAEQSDLLLMTPSAMKRRFNVDVKTYHEVTSINPAAKTVTVSNLAEGTSFEDTFDYLLISTGAEPINPFGNEVFTLRSVGDAAKIRDRASAANAKTALIIGGGFIGLEMAENLASLGLSVTIVEKCAHILPPFDFDMARIFHKYISSSGKVKIITDCGVSSVAGGEITLQNSTKLKADIIISSIGVRPESDLCRAAGIELGVSGGIKTDLNMRTNYPNIYAAGDAVEVCDFATGLPALIPLASPANRQGRIAAENMAGIHSQYIATQGTAILKFGDMSAATTGSSEERLIKLGIPYTKSYTHSPSHATYYPGAHQMSIKLIYTPDGKKILGSQIVGFEGVDKRMDVISTVMRLGAGVHELVSLELAYAPPFSSAKDPINIAGMVASNVVDGLHELFYWDDVADLPQDSCLIDVRSAGEFAAGSIKGAVNIPVDVLRGKLSQLPKGKPIYVFCQIGFRGYLAYRILKQNGFEVYNLSGGYKTYAQAVL